ncbi:gliding motility protein GldN [Flavobacteriaceae bacterium]|nr:gliding motility protein GldN [Flavobacteriaceae bacterium]MDB4152743.1 gliding motility protein GldN [Flavobacteriaceae bacterium]MDB9988603.1 gliding motility protein GldN [Flavobacteriaceae bacterium]MDC1439408.1 gliding motility protein GldN [Flavobacteriaceae bacterium]
MNTRSFYSFILISCTFISTAMAQANLLNARVPQEIGQLNEQQVEANDDTPLAYGFIDDRDILWSKTIWEIVDLDERINFPYYYPTDTLNLGPDRRSLFHVLKKNLRNGKIKEVYDDDYFQSKLTYQEILDKLVAIDTLEAGIEQLNAGEELDPQYINRRTITAAEIRQYRIKGTWYVNKRLGELKYRLLGIAPVAPDVYTLDLPEEEQDLVELFWVWFPDARKSLNASKVFNNRNSSQPITYDHMLNSRRFNSLIYKEENVYEDRKIEEYIFEDALKQLLESERVKSVIRDFEQDLWNN